MARWLPSTDCCIYSFGFSFGSISLRFRRFSRVSRVDSIHRLGEKKGSGKRIASLVALLIRVARVSVASISVSFSS